MLNLQLKSWNVKGIKSPRKKLFWNEVKGNVSTESWAIQEHHLDVSSLWKQWYGRRLVFYGNGEDGSSGVLSIVNSNLEPEVVFNQPLGRVLGIQIKWGDGYLTIFNVYAPNSAKMRSKLWKDLTNLEIEGD